MSPRAPQRKVRCVTCLHCEIRDHGGHCYEKGQHIEDVQEPRYCRPYVQWTQTAIDGETARTRRPR